MYPFERFRDDAKQALTFAAEEATSGSYIGTEHVLIGLTRSDGPARDLLADFGMDAKTVRNAAAGVNQTKPAEHLIPTSRVKTVIELAFQISRQVSNGGVGGIELLLGILLEGEGIAAHLLDEAGVTLETACERAGLDAARVRAAGDGGRYVATNEGRSAGHERGAAGWTGYAEKRDLSEHRTRLRQPDGHGGTIEIEIEFPEDYGPDQRERLVQGILSGLTNALNG